MKKLILTLVAIASCCLVQAQTTKGSFSITGKAGYTASDSKQVTGSNHEYRFERSDYTLSPDIGLFVRDNLEVGITAHFYKREDENQNYFEENSRINYNTIHHEKGMGLYVRKYKYLSEKLAVTGRLAIGLSDSDYQTISNHSAPFQHYSTDKNTERVWASLSPGLTFFASKKLALNMNLGALSYKSLTIDTKSITALDNTGLENPRTTEYREKKNTLELDFSSMHLNFGISYFLGK